MQALRLAGDVLVPDGRHPPGRTDDDAATLRANVTSPGGTTAAGLRQLEERGVRAAVLAAVDAASARSRELSGGSGST